MKVAMTPPTLPPRDSLLRECAVAGCATTTHDAKPYCVDHVELTPYAHGLLEQLALQALEEERVAREGSSAVDLEGLTARSLLQQLELGPLSLARLARKLFLSQEVALGYTLALQEAGRVTSSSSREGRPLLALTGVRP